MNHQDDMHHELNRDEQAALRALRDSRRVTAKDTVRANALASLLSNSAPSARAPRRRRVPWIVAPIAACLVALIIYAAIPRDHWEIVDLVMPQEIEVAGVVPELGARVGGGEIRTTPCSEVELTLENRLRVRFLSEANGILPSAPGRWLRKNRTLTLMSGEVFGSTGGGIDYSFRLRTAEATAVLQGTTFAVFRTDEATCFCLLEGHIEFTPTGAREAIVLPVEQRVFIYKDGRAPEFQDLTARERMKLEMMRDTASQAPTP